MSNIRIFTNTLYYGVIPKISTLINVLLLPIITPFLTPYDYGVWGIITSYTGLILAFAPLGLNMHLTNSYFEFPKWKLIWGRISYIFFVTGGLGSIIGIIILMCSLKEYNFIYRFCLSLCSVIPILLFGNALIASHLYPLIDTPKPLVFRNLAGSLLALIVSFVCIYYFRIGFWGFVLGQMSSSIIIFILFAFALYKNEKIIPIPKIKKERALKWIKTASPVIPHTIGFMLLTSSSRIIMNWYDIPLEDIGIYSQGYTMGDYITLITTALITALSPHIQRAWRNTNYELYRKLYYFSQIITFFLVFTVSLWMPTIYNLLIRNPEFQASITVANHICYAQVLLPFYSFQSSICFIKKDTMQLLWLVFLPAVINILLCLIFVPIYGYNAAIYICLISYWSQLSVPLISKYHSNIFKVWMVSKIKIIYILSLLSVSLFLSTVLVNHAIPTKLFINIIALFTVIFIIKKKSLSNLI